MLGGYKYFFCILPRKPQNKNTNVKTLKQWTLEAIANNLYRPITENYPRRLIEEIHATRNKIFYEMTRNNHYYIKPFCVCCGQYNAECSICKEMLRHSTWIDQQPCRADRAVTGGRCCRPLICTCESLDGGGRDKVKTADFRTAECDVESKRPDCRARATRLSADVM